LTHPEGDALRSSASVQSSRPVLATTGRNIAARAQPKVVRLDNAARACAAGTLSDAGDYGYTEASRTRGVVPCDWTDCTTTPTATVVEHRTSRIASGHPIADSEASSDRQQC
jgi:hypothetical protein